MEICKSGRLAKVLTWNWIFFEPPKCRYMDGFSFGGVKLWMHMREKVGVVCKHSKHKRYKHLSMKIYKARMIKLVVVFGFD